MNELKYITTAQGQQLLKQNNGLLQSNPENAAKYRGYLGEINGITYLVK